MQLTGNNLRNARKLVLKGKKYLSEKKNVEFAMNDKVWFCQADMCTFL